MDGVTILSEMSVRGMELWKVIVWGIATIVYIVFMIWDNVDHWRYSSWTTRIISIICTLMVFAFISMFEVAFIYGYNTFHAEYEVTIDDSVGFNEFNNRYEIISQDGDVYTVIDRQVD